MGPGRVKTFFIFQELHATGRDPRRRGHTRAVTVYRDTLTRGFSHFVTSMTAPVASGWSIHRVRLTPTRKRRLYTAHTPNGHLTRLIHTTIMHTLSSRPTS